MRAVEFESTVTSGGQIELPPEVASEIPAGEQIRIVVMWGDLEKPLDADLAWRTAGQKRFQAAYSPDDTVYEQLIDEVR
jgi:hypothetical protein